MNFEKNLDPKEAIGLGIFSKKDFETHELAQTWFLQNFVKIIKSDRIPDPMPSQTQWNALRDYAGKYIKVRGNDILEYDVEECIERVRQLFKELHEIREMGKKMFRS